MTRPQWTLSPSKWTLLEKMRVVIEVKRLGSEPSDDFLRKEQLTREEYEAFEKETKPVFARARRKGVRSW